MIGGVNHLGIAVRDLEKSMALFQQIFRVEKFHRETVADQKVDIASFKAGEVLIELTAPTDADSPIAKFIEKRGEGIHHVAFTTEGINDELQHLAASGVQLINPTAQKGAHDMMIAFLHPKSTNGVLMELCELPKKA
ncbi:MAG: methylmalonyl-CoA epimerase [Candidatus Kapabacteria bacterium]|jgi:methylmalonyl-CoA/ethylmalonyl-CoA epimerase|nr:methylmalonyl-CoA epimerase [Candidatus Kapabacteria bacterium]